jgi:hypothetical protein
MNWLHFENKATGGTTDVPDEPGVKEWHEARGWTLGEKPEEPIFVPQPGNADPEPSTWVQLYHPGVGATHDFPNNPEAIAGAMESGWVFPVDPQIDGEPDETPSEEPTPKKAPKKTTASAAGTEEKE